MNQPDGAGLAPTRRLYWESDELREAEATVIAVEQDHVAFDGTCFYPGGGGQPHDTGSLVMADGTRLAVPAVSVDASGVIWHRTEPLFPGAVGQVVCQVVDQDRRRALARYHTVLHVLNTIALRDYNGWITGVQIGVDYSRIDFKLEGNLSDLRVQLEDKVNRVLGQRLALKAYRVPEEEFHRRPELLRTLEARPPVVDGQVRIVEIAGFDAQACGGTHVATTSEVGTFAITRTENKGRINKRFYIRLDA